MLGRFRRRRKTKKLKWRRFATGLFQPSASKSSTKRSTSSAATKSPDSTISTTTPRPTSTRISTRRIRHHQRPRYTTNLDIDRREISTTPNARDAGPQRGTLLKVSKDGAKFEVFATGLRNPNGAGGLADGVVTEADNQGEWFPPRASDVDQRRIPRYQPMSHRKFPHRSRKPLCWMHRTSTTPPAANLVIDDRFGPSKTT